MRPPPLWAVILSACLFAWLWLPEAWTGAWRLGLYDLLPAATAPGDPERAQEDHLVRLRLANESLLESMALRDGEMVRLRQLLAQERQLHAQGVAVWPGGGVADSGNDVASWRFWPARVRRLADMGDPDTAVLDKGWTDGVRQGDVVVAGLALAGVVHRVSAKWCRVRWVGHPGWRVSVTIAAPPADDIETLLRQSAGEGADPAAGTDFHPPRGADAMAQDPDASAPRLPAPTPEDRALSRAEGEDPWPLQAHAALRGLGRGRMEVEIHSRLVQAGSGWRLETSGLDGQAPPGLRAGVMAEDPARRDETGARVAAVRPAAALDGLADVHIIRWR